MYNLDSITHAIRAIQTGAPLPESLEDTGSRQFNTSWKVFVEDLMRGEVDVHAKWQATARITNETGTGVFPHNRVDGATRFVAGCYMLCGYELAAPQRKQMPDGFSTPSITDTITAHAVLIIETGRTMATYLENQPIDIRASHTLHNSTTEFYSLMIVALHELRGSVGQPYHDAVDKALEQCERLVSRYDIKPAIPFGVSQRIKQAKFQADFDAVDDLIPSGDHFQQQQQPQWQRMQSRPPSYGEQQAGWRRLGARIRPKQAPIGPDEEKGKVVHFDADAWRDKLKERAGKPKSDKPDFS